MADNIAVTPGVGARVAADDVGGVHYQNVKLDGGADGVSVPIVAVAGALPVAVSNFPATQPVSVSNFPASQPVTLPGSTNNDNELLVAIEDLSVSIKSVLQAIMYPVWLGADGYLRVNTVNNSLNTVNTLTNMTNIGVVQGAVVSGGPMAYQMGDADWQLGVRNRIT